jgi:hypothetical protein
MPSAAAFDVRIRRRPRVPAPTVGAGRTGIEQSRLTTIDGVTVAQLTGTATGRVKPDHRLISILGTGYADSFVPEFTRDRFCYADRDIIYLTSISQHHRASVTLEAWDDALAVRRAGEAIETVELELTTGQVYVCSMMETRVSPVLTVGPPGVYVARAEVFGRHELRERLAHMDMSESLDDIEQFRVRFWPRR